MQSMPRTLVLLTAFLLALSGPLSAAAQGTAEKVPAAPLPQPPRVEDVSPVGAPPGIDEAVGEGYGEATDRYNGSRAVVEAAGGIVDGSPLNLMLYQDGGGTTTTGPDAIRGGFGTPLTFGVNWTRSKAAALTGSYGYATETDAKGHYLNGATGMLLTPELDLNTSYAGNPVFVQGAGSVYGVIYPDGEPRLTFQARYNLGTFGGAGMDGVTLMVFTAKPTTVPASASACMGTCTLVAPRSGIASSNNDLPSFACNNSASAVCSVRTKGYDGSTVALGGLNGFTGAMGWMNYTLSLARYTGQSVWVGFYFASIAAPTSDYFESASFSQAAGFYGFHLDNLRATAPAAHDNLQVRPLREPSFVPEGWLNPVVRPGGEVEVATEVRNGGLLAVRARATLQVISNTTGVEVEYNRSVAEFDLGPGGVKELHATFKAPPSGSKFIARARVEPLPAGNLTSNPRALLGDHDPGDANPADDLRQKPFEVASVHQVVALDMVRSSPTAGPGEKVRLTLPLVNRGNEPASFNLTARVVDLADVDGPDVAPDLLPADQITQHVSMAPFSGKAVSWDVGGVPGQYRLFVRDERDPAFEPDVDLLPTPNQEWLVPFVDLPALGLPAPVMDGSLTDLAWSRGFEVPIEMKNQDQSSTYHDLVTGGTVRMFTDGSSLYVGLNFTNEISGIQPRNLTVLFDVGGDHVAIDGGEDGVHLPLSGAFMDLEFNQASLSFRPDVSQNVAAGRQWAASRVAFEFVRPITSDDLNLGANGRVGMFVRWNHSVPMGARNFATQVFSHFPAGADYRDGGLGSSLTGKAAAYALRLPDGSISDEMSAWQLLRLQPKPGPDEAGALRQPLRVLGPGFGIERSAPPLLFETTSDGCPSQWATDNTITRVPRQAILSPRGAALTEKWTCGPFGPEGRELFFEGLAQDASNVCRGGQCPPYALLGGPESDDTNHWRRHATLTTSPIDIGPTSAPWLVLEHQVSAELLICDQALARPFLDPRLCAPGDVGGLRARSAARVYLDTWDPDAQSWSDGILLRPTDGYSSEASVGIADDRLPVGRTWLADRKSACGATSMTFELSIEDCGWWPPTGWIPSYRPANESIAAGMEFAPSPWRTDRFPLFGGQGVGGGTHLDLEGRTIRLRFVYVRPPFESPIGPERPPSDYGWRIGTVAVLESPRFGQDIAALSVRVGTDLFDPARVGVAPGTNLPVAVAIRNDGLEQATAVKVRVTGFDPRQPNPPLCQSPEVEVEGSLGVDEMLEIPIACGPVVDRPGATLLLRADVESSLDEFSANDRVERQESYRLGTSPDVAVVASAAPRIASDAAVRSLFVTLENRGNVPLTDFDVTRRVFLRTPTGSDLLGAYSRSWRVEGVLPVGGALPLETPELAAGVLPDRDLNFDPPELGTYEFLYEARAAGDQAPQNDVVITRIEARQDLYGETFDAPSLVDPDLVSGKRLLGPAWSVNADGDAHLALGDPAAREIPAGTNSSVQLPWIDLRAMRGATLAFTHRYDLETGFDAGRVEASVDNVTWVPLTPEPQPLGGLPDGYPTLDLFGPGPLVGDAPAATAAAFTGSSASLPGNADGYVKSEVNLARHPTLRARAILDSFGLDGFSPHASAKPVVVGREVRFQHPTWTQPGAAGKDASSWWIQNGTTPSPHSGTAMWWSGTAGESSPERHGVPVCTSLSTGLPLSTVAKRPDERLVLSWWDWRAGWQDDAAGRAGTGGSFDVDVALNDTDMDGLPDADEKRIGTNVTNPDTDGDGFGDGAEYYIWIDPNLTVPNPTTPFAPPAPPPATSPDTNNDGLIDAWAAAYNPGPPSADPDMDGVSNLGEQANGTHPLRADSDGDGIPDLVEILRGTNPRRAPASTVVERAADGWTRRELDLTPYRDEDPDLIFTYASRPSESTQPTAQANLGWLLDDVAVASWLGEARGAPLPVLPVQDMDQINLDPETGQAGSWASTLPAPGLCSATSWSLTSQVPRASGGWHVKPETVPGRGSVPVWRFAGANGQGYPHLADARLVTPTVDLSLVEGTSATLRFSHRFGFEAVAKRPVAPTDGDIVGASYLSATDGGVVEFQVLDEATGEFGPWRQLLRSFRAVPDRLLFAAYDDGTTVAPDQLALDAPPGQVSNRQKPATTGYNAIEERGQYTVRNQPSPTASAGHGSSFETFPGLLRQPAGDWTPYPVSYVFSGASNGWQEESWDISPLRGSQVRFAFHAHSNPGFVNSGLALPFRGWAVADVGVEGEAFRGRPILLRFHAATDGSLTKGAWDIDDLSVVGTPFSRSLRVTLDTPEVLALPEQTVHLYGNVTNLGPGLRPNLALAVSAIHAVTKAPQALTLQAPAGTPVDDAQVTASYRNDTVLAVQQLPSGASMPFHLELTLPASAASFAVRIAVLEQAGPNGTATYRLPPDEGGVPQTVARVVGAVRQDLRLITPPGQTVPLAIAPSNPEKLKPLNVTAAIANHGNTSPGVSVEWSVAEIIRKGPAGNPTIQPEELGWSTNWTMDLGPLVPGAVRTASYQVSPPPPRDGLYRASANFRAADQTIHSTSLEFLVGGDGIYYNVDFAKASGQANWTDQILPGPPPGATGPPPAPSIAWRMSDGKLLWGVNASQAAAGFTYCTAPGVNCNGQARQDNGINQGTPPPVHYGLEGRAVSGLIDLGRVPQGEAFVNLRQGHAFDTDDGGRFEVLPLQTPIDPAVGPMPAFSCDGIGAWFAAAATPTDTYQGFARSLPSMPYVIPPPSPSAGTGVSPVLVNPIARDAPIRAVGGTPTEGEMVQFDLSVPAEPLCPGLSPIYLANYTVQVGLHVGTRPGYMALSASASRPRAGAIGWQVEALQVSSVNFNLQPVTRTLPVIDGAAKRFQVEVANTGSVPDVIRLRLDTNRSTVPDPDWIRFDVDEVTLNPGQRAQVPYTLAIPADSGISRGTYQAVLVASSMRNPLLERRSQMTLGLDPNPLPDLDIRVSLDKSGTPPTFEAGKVAVVHATVFNVGDLRSRGVSLALKAVGPDGQETVVGSVKLPGLCPLPECGKSASTEATFEWQVPPAPGLYRLKAEVDAVASQIEARRDNNLVEVEVRAVPLQRPDVRIDAIQVTGVGADGYVEEGTLVQVTAVVTNAGIAPERDVQVRILAGTSELTEKTLPALAPNETRKVVAFQVAAPGQTVLVATAIPSPLDLEAENNELRRVLNVRGHALGITLDPANLTVAPGEEASLRALVTNRGNAVDRVLVSLEGPGAAGWGIAAQPSPTVLPANATVPVLLLVQAPPGASSGPTPLRVTVRSAALPTAHANATLTATIPLRASAPLLALGNLSTAPGEAAIPLRLESRSNAPQHLNLSLRAPDWTATPRPLTLPAGGRLNATLPITIPLGTKPGLYPIEVEATNRTGPLVAARGLVRVVESVAVRAQWAQAAHGPDSPGARRLDYLLELTNTGNVPGLVRAVPRDLAPGHSAEPVAAATPLAPGATTRLPLQVLVRADTPLGGAGRVEVWAAPAEDGAGAASRRVAILDLPLPGSAANLVLGTLEVLPRGEVEVGSAARLVVRVDNRGALESPATNLSAYVNGVLLQDIPVGPIAAGSSQSLNVTWRAVAPGTVLVTVVADGTQGIPETSEDDNGASLEVVVRDSLAGRLNEAPSPGVVAFLLALAAAALVSRRDGRRRP